MQNLTLANLIHLNKASQLDQIYEGDKASLFNKYVQKLEEQVCEELKISDVFSKFIQYDWWGDYDELPWNEDTNLYFDPTLTSVILPETGNLIQLRGENRKIVLTYPAMFNGDRPFYHILCPSERQIEHIRVLSPLVRNPFYGLDRVFTQKGFNSLPKLKDVKNFGLVFVSEQKMIIPSNSLTYF